MDTYGPLPLTLEQLRDRLSQGQTLVIIAENTQYAIYQKEGRYIVRQGLTEHPFKQLEVAVLTFLCGMGSFYDNDLYREGQP